MRVITISGFAESGKDTTAKILKKYLEARGYKVLIAHYADLLKYICKQYFGWDGKKDEKGRSLLQHIGTDVIRAQNPNFWVEMLSKIIEALSCEFNYCIIPDCRFPNEADVMKEQFHGTTVRVVRPNYRNHLTEEQRNHPSETAMNNYKFDHLIVNTTWESLDNEVYVLMKRMLDEDKKNSD